MQTSELFAALRKPLALLLLLALAGACSAQKSGPRSGSHDSGNGGGIDPGGGKFIHSSRSEVIKIVNGVWDELTSSGSDNPMLIAYLKLNNTGKKSSDQNHVFEMLNRILWDDKKAPDPFFFNDKGVFPSTRLAQLKGRKIQFADTGHCDGDQDDTLIAVTRFDFDGDICVNVKAMMASSTSSSKFDVMALMVHEIAHLAGYRHSSSDINNDDLARIQNFFLKNAAVFYKMDGLSAKGNYACELSYSTNSWYSFSPALPIDQDFLSSMVGVAERTDFAAHSLPDAQVDTELHIAHPEMESQVNEKFQNLIVKLKSFPANWDNYEKAFPDRKSKPLDKDLLSDLRDIMLAQLDIEQTINEYLFGKAIPTKSCLRTKEEIDADRELAIEITNPGLINRSATGDATFPPSLRDKMKQRASKDMDDLPPFKTATHRQFFDIEGLPQDGE